ncbi:DUF3857 domain-containing protein [Sphingomonas naphthae]|uniref:DUF3857 domain-containing protein n=1 Tax=Sphingomonas naphthae TaxID=1813468 RepID=A0ABY7TLX9_9SPHN|nr:DUF3857 domain-containing protein [Sphingomonas naphthae]WCT74003.1 DUF3857 domain-containing protein [Sphingomonas naphthae]
MKTLRFAALASISLLAHPAFAADKLLYGPPADWVKPIPVRPDIAPPGDVPVRPLLQDQQVRLDRTAQYRFLRSMMKIQTAQGLSAGTINISWKPDTDDLTIHKLLIHRGDQVIDVLAKGQTFTVLRRETNLERAALDGNLTATIQPEGLQVGDVIEFSGTLKRSDPVLKGHVEQAGATWNGATIAQASFRASWPADLPLRLRQTEDLPVPKPEKAGDRMTLAIQMDGAKPLIRPAKAPPRFQRGRILEMSDFAAWSDVADLMRPYFDKTAQLPATGPLQDELKRIATLSPDPKLRAEAALVLVQTKVRYLALSMNDGGLVPAAAELTWSRRFGDCKGKTVLLLALLHALGIEAEAVLVNSPTGDGIDAMLPMVGAFDHVLVRAHIAGKTYWLDGTRPADTDIDRLEVPTFVWGLPLIEKSALVRIMPEPLKEPSVIARSRIDASAGAFAPAPFHGEIILRGDNALKIRLGLANASAEQKDQAIRKLMMQRYDFVQFKTTAMKWDDRTGSLTLGGDGMATLEWTERRYSPDGMDVGNRADFTREPGPHQDAPFTVGYPAYFQAEEEVLLPATGFTLVNGEAVDKTVAGAAYTRRASVDGKLFKVMTTQRSLASEFPAADAPAAQATLRALFARKVHLVLPESIKDPAE